MRLLDGVMVDLEWTNTVAEGVPTLSADAFRHLDAGIYVIDLVTDDGTISAVQVEPGATVGVVVEVGGVPVGAQVARP